ncbi:unnamed protein product [Malus baccata var. baccata]
MDGRATPSVSPKKARTAKRLVVEWLAAHGVRRVAKDHMAKPHAITVFPPYLSTKAPPITDDTVYPHRKDDWDYCKMNRSHSKLSIMRREKKSRKAKQEK